MCVSVRGKQKTTMSKRRNEQKKAQLAGRKQNKVENPTEMQSSKNKTVKQEKQTRPKKSKRERKNICKKSTIKIAQKDSGRECTRHAKKMQ